ncbi:hypothetical protein BJV74DRAFT_97541 [Russula compacta]|nr:hypothetical protein BJV74DRAFT_97541 [Russula compacta]
MDPAGLCPRILAKHPSWHLCEKRIADIRSRALADGRLRRPAFEAGIRMQPSMEEVRLREHTYNFDPRWRSASRAQASKLTNSFEIVSGTSSSLSPVRVSWQQLSDGRTRKKKKKTGEVVWGQLAAFVSGMKSSLRDKENLSSPRASPWRFRAAARPGLWHVRSPFPSHLLYPWMADSCHSLPQVARVNAAPAPFSHSQPTGFLLHHTDVDPASVLVCARRGDAGVPCVARLGSGGWGAEDRDDMMHTIVDVDPEEWNALWARRWQMYLDGIWPDRYHEDAERWARLDALRARAAFFVDAAHAPEVLRLIAR